MTQRRARTLAPGAALAAALLLAAAASGHSRSTSTSSWEVEATSPRGARVVARVPWSALQQALPEVAGATQQMVAMRPDLSALVDRYLAERIALFAGASRCELAGRLRPVPTPDPTHAARTWRVRCRANGDLRLRVAAFFDVAQSHVHIARVEREGGESLERVFVAGSTELALDAPAAETAESAAGFLDYLRLGVEHIATGTDHLVFLLALLLLGSSFVEVATIVTGFTLSHSVTLALGALGVVEPLPAAIEALIGLSIAIVALENFALTVGPATRRAIVAALAVSLLGASVAAAAGAVSVPALALVGVGVFSLAYLQLLQRAARPDRLRWCVAFVFGLIHGFGFAGLLTEIGLPRDHLVPALLGFNLGVELGQLAIVAVAWPLLLAIFSRNAPRWAFVVQAGSAPVLAAGLYWFLTRAVG